MIILKIVIQHACDTHTLLYMRDMRVLGEGLATRIQATRIQDLATRIQVFCTVCSPLDLVLSSES